MSSKRNLLIAAGTAAAAAVLVVAAAAVWTTLRGGPDLMAESPLGEIALGRDDAPVTIIEYASTTCPHCARFHSVTFPELQRRAIDTGQVRYIFREFPLSDLDLFAFALARCAGNDKFLPVVGALFKEQEFWVVSAPLDPLKQVAKRAGLSDETIEACSKDKRIAEGVLWSSQHGIKLGVQSTPTFFINGTKHTGALRLEELQRLIAQHLKR